MFQENPITQTYSVDSETILGLHNDAKQRAHMRENILYHGVIMKS